MQELPPACASDEIEAELVQIERTIARLDAMAAKLWGAHTQIHPLEPAEDAPPGPDPAGQPD